MFIGTLCFWLPDLFFQITLRSFSVDACLIAVTLIDPICTLTAYIFLKKKNFIVIYQKTAAFAFILGIWLLGPIFIALGTIPHGGSFFDPEFFSLWFENPIVSTFIMSTYSGSLGGLGLGTICLLIIGIWDIGLKKILTRLFEQRTAK